MTQDLEYLRHQDDLDAAYEAREAEREKEPEFVSMPVMTEDEEALHVCPVCACHDCGDEEHAAWVIADADLDWLKTEEQAL